MAEIGLAEASRLTGKNRSTLHRAMKTGRLSYTVNDAGERRIDVAELQRVFGLRSSPVELINGATVEATSGSLQRHSAQQGEVAALRDTIERQDATIRDLRQRLDESERRRDESERRRDESEAERRQLSERLAGLLTHRRAGSVPPVAPRSPWWQRWLRR